MKLKQTLIGIFVGLILGAAGTWLLTKHPATSTGPGEEHEKKAEKEHEAHRPTVVKLSHEGQTNAGLQTVLPAAAGVNPEIKGYGRVLDPAPLVMALFDLDTARNALSISTKEHARIQALFAQNQNASQQALETAEAAVKRDQLLLEAARARLLTSTGPALAGRNDLPALAQSLASLHTALVRIDLLPGASWEPTAGARLAPLAASGKLAEAEFVGAAPSTDAQTQGPGFVFLLRTNAPPPGTAMVGHLPSSGPAEKGWQIPRGAVVWYEGAAWIYEQTGDEEFERFLVTLERPWAEGWLVTGEVSGTNRLVVVGAQTLLSEQLKGAGGEE
jgi:hypothetical protein